MKWFNRNKSSKNLANNGGQKKAKSYNYANQIAPKSMARTRQDVGNWKKALTLAKKADDPKRSLINNLYEDILLDALLTSQIENRLLKSLSKDICFKKPNGEVDEELTNSLKNKKWVSELSRYILELPYFAHSLVELAFDDLGELCVELIPRQNVEPRDGILFYDYTEDKGVNYREQAEYGTWLLEFGDHKNLGLLNKAVPHVLFKKFAESCWSELCEIYGIPPRVLTTNTHDKTMVNRGERMMRDMGAAAWFIIDESEKFEWAQGVSTNGDVYKNLINLCNNELSLLISGAVIGQDTKNGSRSKDESAQEMLQDLVNSDLALLEREWNTVVIPALAKLGIVPADTRFEYEQVEDVQQLWERTKESLPFFNINKEWAEEKFGMKIDSVKTPTQPQELNLNGDFFV